MGLRQFMLAVSDRRCSQAHTLKYALRGSAPGRRQFNLAGVQTTTESVGACKMLITQLFFDTRQIKYIKPHHSGVRQLLRGIVTFSSGSANDSNTEVIMVCQMMALCTPPLHNLLVPGNPCVAELSTGQIESAARSDCSVLRRRARE